MKEPVLQALAKIILPQGSTSADLQAAIDSIALEDMIIISGDMPFTGTVMIPADKEITIQSDKGNNWGLMEGTGIRHFIISGSLILAHITLDCIEGNAGGIVLNSGGKFVMNDGAVIQNCSSNDGGGAAMNNDCQFIMNRGAVIQNCAANTSNGVGGGVLMGSNCQLTLNGNAVIRNCRSRDGGGIGMIYGVGTRLIMNDSAIIQNCTANYRGGGIIMNDGNSHLSVMNGSAAIQNCTAGWGGGIAVGKGDRFFMYDSTVIGDCMAYNEGGGVFIQYQDNQFFMNDSAGIQSCNASGGGGICIRGNGQVVMNDDSEIKSCTGGYDGGGVFSVDNSRLIMNGRTAIRDCFVHENGGGVYVRDEGSRLVMRADAMIEKCVAGGSGGGVLLHDSGALTMSSGTISGCKADNGYGGGVYASADCTAEITGKSRITGSSASNGNGGGIYSADTTYRSLSTGGDVVFASNFASVAHAPPQNAAELYSKLQFASTSITNHPLNNYDIGYTGGDPIAPTHNMIYDANGGTGSYQDVDIPSVSEYTILSAEETGICWAGYTFTGWNLEPDGIGTSYAPGDVITSDSNMTLYAQWTAAFHMVSYNANEGIGSHADTDIPYGLEYTVLSADTAGISRLGYTFSGWNMQPDNSGTDYAPEDILTINGDVTLHAQWTAILYTIIYHANDGTGGYTDMDIAHGSEYAVLSADTVGISRSGHTFNGWNMQPDNGGTDCAPEDMLIIDGDVTLHAQWTAILYTVVYHANDGTGGHTDMDIAHGSEYTVLSADAVGVSRSGYAFNGWNMQPDNDGIDCAPEDMLIVKGDVTLYAQWTTIYYTAIYHANGGTGGCMEEGIAHGSNYTVLSAYAVGISRAGYNFSGWDTQPGRCGTAYAPKDTLIIDGMVAFYAQWTPTCIPYENEFGIDFCEEFSNACCEKYR